MNSAAPFTIDLLQLADGARVIRVVDLPSGTALERRIDPAQPVVRQKETLVQALRALLERELRAAALG